MIDVLRKGVVVVPNTTAWTGPWLGATRATALQRVANRPILSHVLDALREAGVVEVAIVSPHDVAEAVAAGVGVDGPDGLAIEFLVEDQLEGGRSLRAAVEFVDGAPCILHRADGLLGQPLSPFVDADDEQDPDALLLVQDGAGPDRRLKLVTQRPLSAAHRGSAPISAGVAGVCLLGPGILGHLPNPDRSAQLLNFAALAEQLARDGDSVEVRSVRKWRNFSGDALDLLDMNRTVLDALDSEITPSAEDDNRFEGPISIHPTARVTSSVIIGPAMIGADALISDSYIGPHTSIGERVRIEGSELERSIVLADASVLHVGGRLVASIVGRHARIFRDFSMPRAMRLQVGDGDEVALC